jgi:hypothetical protein
LYVGVSGTGTLNIAGGGAVAATSVSINSKSLLAIDVGNDSLLNIGGGSGTITNKGTVRLLAGASAAAGTPYSPIAAGIWTGTGTYRAVGGKWNATSHTFAASAVQEIQPGVATSVVLNAIQRVMINDVGPDGSPWSAGVSFVPSSGTATVTASAIGSDATAVIESLLAERLPVVNAFEFSMTGSVISSTNPAYLSFDIGSGFSRNDLDVWHYADGAWSAYSASDLTYDGDYASFTVTSLGGYAIVAAVPEPSTLVLLLAGLLSVLVRDWRRRQQAV